MKLWASKKANKWNAKFQCVKKGCGNWNSNGHLIGIRPIAFIWRRYEMTNVEALALQEGTHKASADTPSHDVSACPAAKYWNWNCNPSQIIWYWSAALRESHQKKQSYEGVLPSLCLSFLGLMWLIWWMLTNKSKAACSTAWSVPSVSHALSHACPLTLPWFVHCLWFGATVAIGYIFSFVWRLKAALTYLLLFQ